MHHSTHRPPAREGYFVDWLSVSQYHGELTEGGEKPREWVGSITFKYDKNGEPLCETAGSRKHEGSYSTSLQIRSYDGWVSVSGNPGRFGRPDNLFGLDLQGCMDVVNRELNLLDLPSFTKGHEMAPSSEEVERGAFSKWTGATFSRVDVTRGFETGSELAARLVMRAYQRQSLARMTRSVWGGDTVQWKTVRRTVKAYLKGPEMAAHGLGESEWCRWATERGVVRHEVEFHRRFLGESGLRYWGNLDMAKLVHLHLLETEHLHSPECAHDPIALDCIPARVRVTYAAWLRGEPVRELLPRATYYRHRALLLDQAGVDISNTRDLSFVQPQIKTVELRPAVAPAEYWLRAA